MQVDAAVKDKKRTLVSKLQKQDWKRKDGENQFWWDFLVSRLGLVYDSASYFIYLK